MKAKITDVAQKANVSISTVSHVLNHTRFVSEETRKKVMDAVEELGYSPDASGRTFRTGKKMMIGLVVPDITNSVFAALIEDVDDVISKQGYNLVISNTRDCLKMEKQALRNLASGVVDGIVIASTSEDFQTIKRQIPDKFPMIFMDRVLPDRNYDSVILDCQEATAKMLEEMIQNGFRKIGFLVGLPQISPTYERVKVYQQILKQYESKVNEEGIRIFDDNIYVYPRDYFYPINYNYSEKVYTKNTCMVHLFKATWTDRGEKRTIGIYRTFGPALGKTLNSIIDGIFNFKTSIIVTLKKIYSWARMKASIYITRSRRVKRITNEINQIQKDFITICHPEMPVEKNEIQNLIEGSILGLREQYTKKEAEMIASAIANSSKKQILFNQYADGWDMLISSIKKQKSSMKVKMIIHNGQEDLTDAIIWNNFDNILGMYDKGLIDELVFLKKSVYEFYKEKGYRAKLLSKYVEIENRESYNEDNKAEKNENLPIKIGMYEAYDRISRNIYNQLCAVSMIESAKLDCSPVNYKISKIARFFNINLTVANKLMTKQELYKKLANNDINLCVSTVDENNMIPYESLELGTPCLVGNSFKAFEGSSLQDYLVVKNADDILEIKEKILNALENRGKILEEYKLWREKNKQDALKNLKEVLE